MNGLVLKVSDQAGSGYRSPGRGAGPHLAFAKRFRLRETLRRTSRRASLHHTTRSSTWLPTHILSYLAHEFTAGPERKLLMHKSILTACLIVLLTAASSCKTVVEPRAYGEYFITNSTDKVILLSATSFGGGEATLLLSAVPVDEKAHIYTFDSNGHVRPSNAFSAFTIYSESKVPANIIYSKVEDADWIEEGVDANGHFIYHLTIN